MKRFLKSGRGTGRDLLLVYLDHSAILHLRDPVGKREYAVVVGDNDHGSFPLQGLATQ